MTLFNRSSTPRWLRLSIGATAMTFTWTFALALPAELLAQGTAPKKAPQSASQPLAAWKPGKRIAPPASPKENLNLIFINDVLGVN